MAEIRIFVFYVVYDIMNNCLISYYLKNYVNNSFMG